MSTGTMRDNVAPVVITQPSVAKGALERIGFLPKRPARSRGLQVTRHGDPTSVTETLEMRSHEDAVALFRSHSASRIIESPLVQDFFEKPDWWMTFTGPVLIDGYQYSSPMLGLVLCDQDGVFRKFGSAGALIGGPFCEPLMEPAAVRRGLLSARADPLESYIALTPGKCVEVEVAIDAKRCVWAIVKRDVLATGLLDMGNKLNSTGVRKMGLACKGAGCVKMKLGILGSYEPAILTAMPEGVMHARLIPCWREMLYKAFPKSEYE